VWGCWQRRPVVQSAAAASPIARRRKGPPTTPAAPASALNPRPGCAHHQAHFDSIQALSERQALEDLLPRLREVLTAATDYEPLRERLRAPGLSAGDKRALWGQLAGQAFTRAMGAVWLVPLLDLLVRGWGPS
jgi:hypothetical protein